MNAQKDFYVREKLNDRIMQLGPQKYWLFSEGGLKGLTLSGNKLKKVLYKFHNPINHCRAIYVPFILRYKDSFIGVDVVE